MIDKTYIEREIQSTLEFYARSGHWFKKVNHLNEIFYTQNGTSISDDGGWRARRILEWQEDNSEFKDMP